MKILETKIDKTSLERARTHRGRVATLLKAAKERDTNDNPEDHALVETLEYALDIMRDHYRNLLHCFSIAEKR